MLVGVFGIFVLTTYLSIYLFIIYLSIYLCLTLPLHIYIHICYMISQGVDHLSKQCCEAFVHCVFNAFNHFLFWSINKFDILTRISGFSKGAVVDANALGRKCDSQRLAWRLRSRLWAPMRGWPEQWKSWWTTAGENWLALKWSFVCKPNCYSTHVQFCVQWCGAKSDSRWLQESAQGPLRTWT